MSSPAEIRQDMLHAARGAPQTTAAIMALPDFALTTPGFVQIYSEMAYKERGNRDYVDYDSDEHSTLDNWGNRVPKSMAATPSGQPSAGKGTKRGSVGSQDSAAKAKLASPPPPSA